MTKCMYVKGMRDYNIPVMRADMFIDKEQDWSIQNEVEWQYTDDYGWGQKLNHDKGCVMMMKVETEEKKKSKQQDGQF